MKQKENSGNEANMRIVDDQIDILVVDDDKFIARVIEKYLESEKYVVHFALDGPEALNMVKEKGNFDLVILDIMMPQMTGYEVCRELRKTYNLFDLPIIILTSKDQVEDLVKGFNAGANDFLSKPFDQNELKARVRTLIKLKILTHSNSVLQEAIETKNQFMQMTIHDLKNPLNVITGFSQLIIDEVGNDSEIAEFARMIAQSAQLMSNLVHELLEMAKFESGLTYLKKEKIDLIGIISDLANNNENFASKKSQKIEFIYDIKKDYFIEADPVRIMEIVDNLISNAIKYSPYNSVIKLFITKQANSDGVRTIRLAVKDTGPGLTEKDKKKLFGRFQRLSARPTGGESSTGLGLSIVKQLVELHHGKIWAEGEPGKGATFFVEFEEC